MVALFLLSEVWRLMLAILFINASNLISFSSRNTCSVCVPCLWMMLLILLYKLLLMLSSAIFLLLSLVVVDHPSGAWNRHCHRAYHAMVQA